MKHRAIWTGHLRLALVHVPVRIYTVLNGAEQISFNQRHAGCHQRVRQKPVCPPHGEVTREQIVKGYEYEKAKFIVADDADIQSVRLETSQTNDLIQFIRPDDLDPIHLDVPLFEINIRPLETFDLFTDPTVTVLGYFRSSYGVGTEKFFS